MVGSVYKYKRAEQPTSSCVLRGRRVSLRSFRTWATCLLAATHASWWQGAQGGCASPPIGAAAALAEAEGALSGLAFFAMRSGRARGRRKGCVVLRGVWRGGARLALRYGSVVRIGRELIRLRRAEWVRTFVQDFHFPAAFFFRPGWRGPMKSNRLCACGCRAAGRWRRVGARRGRAHRVDHQEVALHMLPEERTRVGVAAVFLKPIKGRMVGGRPWMKNSMFRFLTFLLERFLLFELNLSPFPLGINGYAFPIQLALPNKMKLRRMRLINKFLSPKCAHGLGDVDTYFFLKKNRSEVRMCVIVVS